MRYWNKFTDEHVMVYVSMHGGNWMVGVIARSIDSGELNSRRPDFRSRAAREMEDGAVGLQLGGPGWNATRKIEVAVDKAERQLAENAVDRWKHVHARRHQLLHRRLRHSRCAHVSREELRPTRAALHRVGAARDRRARCQSRACMPTLQTPRCARSPARRAEADEALLRPGRVRHGWRERNRLRAGAESFRAWGRQCGSSWWIGTATIWTKSAQRSQGATTCISCTGGRGRQGRDATRGGRGAPTFR